MLLNRGPECSHGVLSRRTGPADPTPYARGDHEGIIRGRTGTPEYDPDATRTPQVPSGTGIRRPKKGTTT